MGHIRHELWMLSKAEMSGAMASIVDFGLAIGLLEVGWLPFQWSNLIGVVCGGVTNCSINYKDVFRTTSRKKKNVAWRYLIVWSGSMTFNGIGTNLATIYAGEKWFVLIKCIIAFFVELCFNYPLQRHFVFNTK